MASREELEVQLRGAIAAGSDDVFEIARKRFEAGFEGYDARQRAHLVELDAVTETLRRFPRVGATFTALSLRLRAQVLLDLSTMPEDEERAYLAEQCALWDELEAEDEAA